MTASVPKYGALEGGEKSLCTTVKNEPQKAPYLHPDSLCYRYAILILSCMIPFGTYFCFDTPATVKPFLTSNTKEGLNLSDTQFNMLYSIYAWPNTILVVFGGQLIDKLGVRRGLVFFLLPCFIGHILFCLSIPLRYTSQPEYGYYGMLVGRFVYGLGGECVVVAQNAFITQWFHGKELAFAFSVTVAISRLGTVMSFNLVPTLAETFSLQAALWSGCFLLVLSFICLLILLMLDSHAERVTERVLQTTVDTQNLRDMFEFPISFWLLCLLNCTFYASCLPFIQNIGGWLNRYWGYTPAKSSSIAGVPFTLSLFLMPIFGMAKDTFGHAAYTLLFASVLICFSQFLLTFSSINILFPLVGIGVAYSIIGAILWSTVPYLVALSSVASALGIGYAAANIGQAVATIIVGYLSNPRPGDVGRKAFERTMNFFVANSSLAVLCALILLFVNSAIKGNLNERRVKEKIGV